MDENKVTEEIKTTDEIKATEEGKEEATKVVETAVDDEKWDAAGNSELKTIAEILKDIKVDEHTEMKFAKRQSVTSLILSVLCLLIVGCVAVAIVMVIPKVNKLLIKNHYILLRVIPIEMGLLTSLKQSSNLFARITCQIEYRSLIWCNAGTINIHTAKKCKKKVKHNKSLIL